MANAEMTSLRICTIVNAKLQNADGRKLNFAAAKAISMVMTDFLRFSTRSTVATAIPSAQIRAMLIKFYPLFCNCRKVASCDFYFLYFVYFCGK